MMRVVALGVLCVVGCSGSGEAGAPERTGRAPQTTEQEEEATMPGNPLPPPEMVERMIAQRVLDAPRVAAMLHLEVAANLPLAVHTVPELARGMPEVQAGGQRVRVVATPADARFVYTAYEQQRGAPRVRVRFEIPPEGASGYVDVELQNYVWRVVDESLVER